MEPPAEIRAKFSQMRNHFDGKTVHDGGQPIKFENGKYIHDLSSYDPKTHTVNQTDNVIVVKGKLDLGTTLEIENSSQGYPSSISARSHGKVKCWDAKKKSFKDCRVDKTTKVEYEVVEVGDEKICRVKKVIISNNKDKKDEHQKTTFDERLCTEIKNDLASPFSQAKKLCAEAMNGFNEKVKGLFSKHNIAYDGQFEEKSLSGDIGSFIRTIDDYWMDCRDYGALKLMDKQEALSKKSASHESDEESAKVRSR